MPYLVILQQNLYMKEQANKEHLGLTNWKNSPNGKIMKYDISIAKNYLNEQEIKKIRKFDNFIFRLCRRHGKRTQSNDNAKMD